VLGLPSVKGEVVLPFFLLRILTTHSPSHSDILSWKIAKRTFSDSPTVSEWKLLFFSLSEVGVPQASSHVVSL